MQVEYAVVQSEMTETTLAEHVAEGDGFGKLSFWHFSSWRRHSTTEPEKGEGVE